MLPPDSGRLTADSAALRPLASRLSSGFDNIVIGAGTAGSVVVRRLLDAGHSVLVLEAGPTDDVPAIHDPARIMEVIGTERDWRSYTEPQVHAAGQALYWVRGRTLGGSSAINGMLYARGFPADYDSWAYRGNDGWDYRSVLPYFVRAEDFAGGASPRRGAGGPLHVSFPPQRSDLGQAVMSASVHCGLARVADYNDPMNPPAMVGWSQSSIVDGRRHSAWQAYVAPVVSRGRLTVHTDALVHRILFDGERATGVEYRVAGRVQRVYADGDIVLSAGAVGTPQVLLLSGIGPADQLRAVGIDVRADLPGVGQNLHDHLVAPVIWAARRPVAPPSGGPFELNAFWPSRPALPTPDTQMLLMPAPHPLVGAQPPANGVTMVNALLRPYSRGILWLRSSDPTEPPAMDPRILADPHDLEVLIDVVETSREIMADAVLRDWGLTETLPGPGVRTREDLRAFWRAHVQPGYHLAGTARMGVDALAAVDPQLRVIGVTGLRVADTSVMPDITSGNTMAPAVMIGEKAADLVLGVPALADGRLATPATPAP
jgi:choline dehydrogenase